MASSYPAGLDTISVPGANLSGPPLHSTVHDEVKDAIEAIEATLGINPQGASATVKARLDGLTASTVGVVGKALNATSTQAVTAEADVTSLTATITAVAGRCYKVSYKIAGTMSAVDMQWWARVYADGSAVDGTYGNRKTFYGTANRWDSLSGVVYVTGLAAGSRVVKLRAATTGGTATIDFANATAYLIVEDIGPA